MPYPHQILLADLKKKGKIKIEDFSSELQTVIEDFEKREKLEQNEETSVSVLEANSWMIAQRIHDYHVEPEDQEVELTAESTTADIHAAADEIIEEEKAETTEETEGSQQGNGTEPPVVEPAIETPVEVPVLETVIEEPIVTDPVEAAIAAGAAKPETQPIAEVSAPIATEATDQAIPGYEPKGDEAVIHKLFSSGNKEGITLQDLKEAGVDIGKVSGLDATRYGRYTIKPIGFMTRKYNITFK